MTDLTKLIEAQQAICDAATPNWEFRPGHEHGDDLLVAEVANHNEDEEPEYAEVLYDSGAFGDAQLAANWTFLPMARASLPALLKVARAAVNLTMKFPLHPDKFDVLRAALEGWARSQEGR